MKKSFVAEQTTHLRTGFTHWRERITAVWMPALTKPATLLLIGEIWMVVIWAFFAGRTLMNFDSTFWPAGYEFPLSVRANFFWSNAQRCGLCALWNGNMNGGYPALIDLQGAVLHPLVALPTLLFGVVNGGKLSVILAMALGGLAQLWLGRLLGLGVPARIWAALLAVVAGSLTGRMENGLVVLVVSSASAALAIPAGLNLAMRPGPRSGVIFALVLASAALSGQGYLQIGLAAAILPMLLVYILTGREQRKPALVTLGLSLGLTILLAAVLLVPLLANSGTTVKDIDLEFKSVQPLEYMPLNLLIRDPQFFRSDALTKLPYPYLYINYIGWIPVLLAFVSLAFVPASRKRLYFFFAGAVTLVYLVSTMVLPRLLLGMIAEEILASVRHPTLIASLAVPLVLGLSAWGLDGLLRSGPVVNFQWSPEESRSLHLSAVLLVVPLVWSLFSAYQFSAIWLGQIQQPVESRAIFKDAGLAPAQWTQMLSGELYWSITAPQAGIKLTEAFHPWHLTNRSMPPAQVLLDRATIEAAPGLTVDVVDGMYVARSATAQYASVLLNNKNEIVPCQANAVGGNIDVLCDLPAPGVLTVYEHSWRGWTAWMGGQRTGLIPGEWLSVLMPAGKTVVSLRYQSLDFLIGLAITLVGWGLLMGWLGRPAKDE